MGWGDVSFGAKTARGVFFERFPFHRIARKIQGIKTDALTFSSNISRHFKEQFGTIRFFEIALHVHQNIRIDRFQCCLVCLIHPSHKHLPLLTLLAHSRNLSLIQETTLPSTYSIPIAIIAIHRLFAKKIAIVQVQPRRTLEEAFRTRFERPRCQGGVVRFVFVRETVYLPPSLR